MTAGINDRQAGGRAASPASFFYISNTALFQNGFEAGTNPPASTFDTVDATSSASALAGWPVTCEGYVEMTGCAGRLGGVF